MHLYAYLHSEIEILHIDGTALINICGKRTAGRYYCYLDLTHCHAFCVLLKNSIVRHMAFYLPRSFARCYLLFRVKCSHNQAVATIREEHRTFFT